MDKTENAGRVMRFVDTFFQGLNSQKVTTDYGVYIDYLNYRLRGALVVALTEPGAPPLAKHSQALIDTMRDVFRACIPTGEELEKYAEGYASTWVLFADMWDILDLLWEEKTGLAIHVGDRSQVSTHWILERVGMLTVEALSRRIVRDADTAFESLLETMLGEESDHVRVCLKIFD